MNLKDDVLKPNRAQGRAKLNKTTFTCRNTFVKPAPPKPPRKKTKSSTTSSSSTRINWGAPKLSSTTLNTGSSSRTTSSTRDEDEIILALTEGRGNATSEIGMAIVNLNRPSITLCQLSDTKNYVNTLTKINIINPTEIIVPLTFIEGRYKSRLLEKIQQQFNNVKVTGFKRSAFNKTNGSERIKSLCLPQYNSVLLCLQHKYYCLSAASALLLFIENLRNVYYARESVKIVYQESEGTMIIDVSAADKLELVENEVIVHPSQKSTLFSVLNHCLTGIGRRMLRATILQPPCSIPDIEARLDCITELIKKQETHAAIQAILMKLNNIDQILSLATLMPASFDRYSERQLNYIIRLNLILDQIAPLKETLNETEHQFFRDLCKTLSSARLSNLRQRLKETIKSDAYPTKGSNATFQRCFAIKPGVNSFLDAVRKTYSDLLNEMTKYVEELGRTYGMNLTLSNNNKKGFHIVFALTPQQRKTLKKSELPQEFIQICRMSGSFTMKTEELTTYSVRIDDITANILEISNGIIRGLLMEIRDHLDLFYKLVEDIAKLDVLQSLAEASTGKYYVRPHFADYTDIANAKHPMLDVILSKEPIANPVQLNKDYNFHIITGPNGSGKSIYIRQVALIQIMAQVGSYVPATSATLRVCDRLFTRISLNDNMECNVSSLELELLEIKHFLTTMTNHSLVIIDELCRSTAVEEGTALAMAICEKMLMTPAFILITTHYTLITKLQELYCNVKVWQMEAHVTGTDILNTKLDLKYNLIPGCTSLKRYGIYLIAKLWPENIVRYIENILDDITRTQPPQDLKVDGVSAKSRLIYEVNAEFEMLKEKKSLTKAAINAILNKYQQQLQEYGVKIIQEDKESEQQTSVENFDAISATQVTYNYVPQENAENSVNYERMRDFPHNSEHFNYLIPDTPLRKKSRPNLNLDYLCSQNDLDVSVSFNSAKQFSEIQDSVQLTPIQETVSQPLTQFSNVSQQKQSFLESRPFSLDDRQCSLSSINKNFTFTKGVEESPFFIPQQIDFDNASSEFFVNSKKFCNKSFGSAAVTPIVFNDRNRADNFVVDDGSVFSSVNRTKFMESWKEASTPMQNQKVSTHHQQFLESFEKTPTPIRREKGVSNPANQSAKQVRLTSINQLNQSVNQATSSAIESSVPIGTSVNQRRQSIHRSAERRSISQTIETSLNQSGTTPFEIRVNQPSQLINQSRSTPAETWVNQPCQPMQQSWSNSVDSFVNQTWLTPIGTDANQLHCSTNQTKSTLVGVATIISPAQNITNTSSSDNPRAKSVHETSFSSTQLLIDRQPSTSSSAMRSYYTPPNDLSFASSINCSKFLAGLTRTSTPIIHNPHPDATSSIYMSFDDDNETANDYSITYSPLCPSPTKQTKRLGTCVRSKFIPPNKLTKRQIQAEFAEQTRKMMECSDPTKITDYARQICNRPTVKQLQESEYIASIKRTEEGVVVIPANAERRKTQRRRKFTFNAPHKKVFDPKWLSDENEDKFNEFLEKSKKGRSGETDFSGHSSQYVSFTPKSYYKQHENEIKQIVDKYLKSQDDDQSDV